MKPTFFSLGRKISRYAFLGASFFFLVFYALSIVSQRMNPSEIIPILSGIFTMFTMSSFIIAIDVFVLTHKEKIAKIIFIVFGGYLFVKMLLDKFEVARTLVYGVSIAYGIGVVFGFLSALVGIVIIGMLLFQLFFKKKLHPLFFIAPSLLYILVSFIGGVVLAIGYAVDYHPWYYSIIEITNSIIMPPYLMFGVFTLLLPKVKDEEELKPLFTKKLGTLISLLAMSAVSATTLLAVSIVGLTSYRIAPWGIDAAATREKPYIGQGYEMSLFYEGDNVSKGTVGKTLSYQIYGKGEVYYVDFVEAYQNLVGNLKASGNQTTADYKFSIVSNENATYTLTSKIGSIELDVFRDKMTVFNYYPVMARQAYENGVNVTPISGIESNCKVLTTSKTVVKPNNKVVLNFGKYGIDIIAYVDTKDRSIQIFMPVQTFVDVFFTSDNYPVAFNGRNLYLTNGFARKGMKADKNSLEYDYYNDSPWCDRETREAELTKFTYWEYIFYLDTFYGLKEYRRIASFDQWIQRLGLKNGLLSTSSAVYEESYIKFVCRHLSDVHTTYSQQSAYVASKDYTQLIKDEYAGNPQYKSVSSALSEDYLNARKSAGKEVGVTFSTNNRTAIIRFDAFNKMSGASQVTDVSNYDYQLLHDADTYLFFKKAFGEIEEKSMVKNVILDMSVNGGGAVAAVPYVLGFLVKNPKCAFRNRMTGEISELHFELDLNGDGKYASDGDSYEGKYSFFVLTSRGSFSCGNAFPTFVQDYTDIPIIGETSGGGACCVGQMSTASGSMGSMSCQIQFVRLYGTNYSLDEAGVSPNRWLHSSLWYDDNALDNFVGNF